MAGETEWEDALIKHGIMAKPVKGPTDDELALEWIEEQKRKDELAGKSLKQLDELEDEVDGDKLDGYRAKRIAEMKAAAERNRFGDYREIGETEFVDEVSKAGDGVSVVLHLYARKPECDLVNRILGQLAPRFRHVKFLRIVGGQCIHGYPDSRCPTVLIYRDGDIVRQVVGLGEFGGSKSNASTVEWVLSEENVLKTELDHDPRKDLLKMNVRRNVKNRRNIDSDDDLSSDDDDDEE